MGADGARTVAAIIPCYNGAEFLTEAVESGEEAGEAVDEAAGGTEEESSE